MGKWEMVRLGDVCTIVSGTTPKSSVSDYWNGTYNWVTPAELSADSEIIFDTQRKITEEGIRNSSLRSFPAGTVLLSSRAPIGKVAIAGREMYCNQGFKNFICSNSILNKYLFWFLKGKNNYLNSLGRGATFKEISKRIVEEIEIPLPPLEIQQKIAATLDTTAALLKLRQQQLAELDALIQSVFYQMFGDEKDISKWNCKKIQDIANVTVGVVIKPAQYYTDSEEGIRAFRSLNVGKMKVKDDNWVYFTTEGHKVNRKSEVKLHDVLIVRSGNPGISCVVTEEFVGCNAIDIIIARPDKIIIEPTYLCAFTNFPHGRNQIKKKTGGAAQQHYNVGAYKNMTIALPPLSLQNQFAAIVQKIDQQKATVQQSIDETQILFDSLMSQYFD